MAVGRQETGADRKHILIVDDDPTELKTLRYYLQESHNGAAVLKDIQSRVETKNIPVFFLTGQTDADTIRECLALHPAGYIVKPVAKTALLDKMKEVLG